MRNPSALGNTCTEVLLQHPLSEAVAPSRSLSPVFFILCPLSLHLCLWHLSLPRSSSPLPTKVCQPPSTFKMAQTFFSPSSYSLLSPLLSSANFFAGTPQFLPFTSACCPLTSNPMISPVYLLQMNSLGSGLCSFLIL